MKNKFYVKDNCTYDDVLNYDYTILRARLAVCFYVDKLIAILKNAVKNEDDFLAKYVFKKLKNVSSKKQNVQELKDMYNKKLYADLFALTNVKKIVGYGISDTFDEFERLAIRGNLKAAALHLRMAPQKSEKLIAMARSIEKKEIKTPEEFEVCASLYFKDKIEIFGQGFENVDSVYKLLNYYQKCLAEAESIKRSNGVFKKFAGDDYFVNLKVEYAKNKLFDLKFTKYLQQAQNGYLKRFVEKKSVDDIANFLDVATDGFELLVDEKRIDKHFRFKDKSISQVMSKAMDAGYDYFKNKGACDLVVYFWHNNMKVDQAKSFGSDKHILRIEKVAQLKPFTKPVFDKMDNLERVSR